MKIGLLVLSVGNFGRKGFYNLQEVGLAKALGRNGHTVEIYKCVNKNQSAKPEQIAPHVVFHTVGLATVGNNSLFRCEKVLDSTLDMLVCFSDIQPMTSRVRQWAEKHHVAFVPYIGSTHSTSTSAVRRTLINLLACSAYAAYQKSGALVKTNAVKDELMKKGVTDIQVAPVGIDSDLLHRGYNVPREALLSALGLPDGMKYLLMVGRIESDRDPLDAVTVLDALHEKEAGYRLIVIGSGSLKQELADRLREKGLSDLVIWIEKVPNSEMWQYYRVSSALISFSRTEIFGMSILEAMYYGLPVYVMHAPGPDDIIVDGESGFLFSSPEEMAAAIADHPAGNIGEQAHRRVVERFCWADTVRLIESRHN